MANTRGLGFIVETGSSATQTRSGALVVETTSSIPSITYLINLDDVAFSGSSKVIPVSIFTATLGDMVFSGSSSAGVVSGTYSITLADITFSGSSSSNIVSGILTTPVLKNNTGTLLSSESNATAYIYSPSTGDLVVKKTSLTTNGSGVMTITDPLIVATTQYRVVIVLNSGAEGMEKITAT